MADPIPLVSGLGQLGGLFSAVVNRILVAAIILLVGLVAGRIAGKFVEHMLHGMELNKAVNLATGARISVEEIGSRIVTYAIYFVVVVAALEYLGVHTAIFTVLSIAVIAVIAVSFLLAIRDMIPNAMAGIIVQRKGLLKPGDRVKISGVEGEVVKVELFETRLQTRKKDTIFVPNASILKHEIVRKRRKKG